MPNFQSTLANMYYLESCTKMIPHVLNAAATALFWPYAAELLGIRQRTTLLPSSSPSPDHIQSLYRNIKHSLRG